MYFGRKLAYPAAALNVPLKTGDPRMAAPGQEAGQEKRKSPRKEMKVPAKVHTGDGGISAEALNLSQSGIFLDCATKVSEGSAVDIVMILPKEITGDAAKWVCCRATVNRVEDARSQGRYGVAATVDRIQAMPELTWPEVDRRISDRRAGERRVAARGGQDRRQRERRNPPSK
jgi:PilZ domain-containing protein